MDNTDKDNTGEEKEVLLKKTNESLPLRSDDCDTTRPGATSVSETVSEQSRSTAILETIPVLTDSGKSVSSDIRICRICLEEDEKNKLVTPCGCTGTQKYAHQECIQKWINEKGHLKCEVCSQNYQGSFSVPPPAPSPQPFDGVEVLDTPAVEIRVNGYDRGTDFLDEADPYYSRNPAASWCLTFVIFVFFLVILHHTILVADEMDENNNNYNSPSPQLSPPPMDADDQYEADFSVFLFWVLTKALLIGIPLYTVMRMAARQAGREHYEAMVRYSTAYDASAQRLIFRYRMRQAREAREARDSVRAENAAREHNVIPSDTNV
uniref:RING-CH-type domain-containing protein n=1 Tax=Polytomella parva TaxID=51329 RepID=A0A7S0UQY1_9CHLO|mmetsp:Transcript_13332/g.23603  ORF Transcript_13332/g.23603 Transcript_13332/m.23603 type:complete len:322 (+) Transcript_13332:242-1207(+)|eukprot:CAMPEP_0175039630 /NCGR_PEP_ID=MMETSP0052_2-20121109/713_1 /TAXON_ID=51329 ORGANISM="Polytomella parva, Strain SAG 63-3" /NCGR_SAMPLE_ID=MMETSP0052_2 /ASSEMBLY_ACC=CAM_ASM_000194 /LENGTH=321 /DNA_ID=CAMNT_0016301549 /DNA_START=132 /DNA_END=1097 /DNA_ORIENTATION=+